MEKDKEINIVAILGTARKDNQSSRAARFVVQQADKFGLAVRFIDVSEILSAKTIPPSNQHPNPKALQWRQDMKTADGLIIVSPEYNHSFPGELKIALDFLYPEYEKKPVGICGVSSGGMGGVRVVEQLRLVAIALKMVPISSAVYFSNISSLFDEQGNITDSSYEKRMTNFFTELSWYAKALKQARENL